MDKYKDLFFRQKDALRDAQSNYQHQLESNKVLRKRVQELEKENSYVAIWMDKYHEAMVRVGELEKESQRLNAELDRMGKSNNDLCDKIFEIESKLKRTVKCKTCDNYGDAQMCLSCNDCDLYVDSRNDYMEGE